MSTISALADSMNAVAGNASTTKNQAGAEDRFLKLLIAQMQNQDPMNPLDNAQMTSQIAQINTVTGIQQLNQTMQSMATQFNSLQVMQGTSLIGRHVMTEGSSLPVTDAVGKGGFELGSPATDVKIEVMTAGGQVIDTVDLGAQSAGRHTFEWDASAYAGATEALQFRVTAVNGSSAVATTALSLAKVTSAGAEDGQLVLSLSNGQTINYSQIKALV